LRTYGREGIYRKVEEVKKGKKGVTQAMKNAGNFFDLFDFAVNHSAKVREINRTGREKSAEICVICGQFEPAAIWRNLRTF
jgi:hypothetical protein